MPQLGVARRELGGAVKLREGVVEVEARQRELGGAPQPAQRRRRELLELVLAVPPGELRDVGGDRLGVVVRQHAGAAVRRVVRLEPAREGGVQARAARLRQAAVGDLAGERVLEDELGLRGADEAALHEGAHLGARAGQRGQASRSERAADHRGGLERLLRLGRQQVDAGGEDAAGRSPGCRDRPRRRGATSRPSPRSSSPLSRRSASTSSTKNGFPSRVAGDQLQCARVERARERGLDELGHLLVGEALQRSARPPPGTRPDPAASSRARGPGPPPPRARARAPRPAARPPSADPR